MPHLARHRPGRAAARPPLRPGRLHWPNPHFTAQAGPVKPGSAGEARAAAGEAAPELDPAAEEDARPGGRSTAEPPESVQQRALDSFHTIVGQLDMAMHIITATSESGESNGCLLGFASQCAIHPPRYLVWISKNNHTFDVAQGAEALGVHFLAPGQADIAERFGTRSGDHVDKLADERWHPGPLGVPILDEIAQWFVGRILDRIEVGDHMGYLLEPVAASTAPVALGQLGFQAVKHLDAGHDAG